MMSFGVKQKRASRSDYAQPMECAQKPPTQWQGRREQILQLKGFVGGVPLNTETTAVNPRVGIEEIAKRCLFFVEMARAGSAMTLPALFDFFHALQATTQGLACFGEQVGA